MSFFSYLLGIGNYEAPIDEDFIDLRELQNQNIDESALKILFALDRMGTYDGYLTVSELAPLDKVKNGIFEPEDVEKMSREIECKDDTYKTENGDFCNDRLTFANKLKWNSTEVFGLSRVFERYHTVASQVFSRSYFTEQSLREAGAPHPYKTAHQRLLEIIDGPLSQVFLDLYHGSVQPKNLEILHEAVSRYNPEFDTLLSRVFDLQQEAQNVQDPKTTQVLKLWEEINDRFLIPEKIYVNLTPTNYNTVTGVFEDRYDKFSFAVATITKNERARNPADPEKWVRILYLKDYATRYEEINNQEVYDPDTHSYYQTFDVSVTGGDLGQTLSEDRVLINVTEIEKAADAVFSSPNSSSQSSQVSHSILPLKQFDRQAWIDARLRLTRTHELSHAGDCALGISDALLTQDRESRSYLSMLEDDDWALAFHCSTSALLEYYGNTRYTEKDSYGLGPLKPRQFHTSNAVGWAQALYSLGLELKDPDDPKKPILVHQQNVYIDYVKMPAEKIGRALGLLSPQERQALMEKIKKKYFSPQK